MSYMSEDELSPSAFQIPGATHATGNRKRRSQIGLLALELLVVAAFALFYSKQFFRLPHSYVPVGGDYGVSIFGRFFWDDVRACGVCALWNSNYDGGNPAYLDVSSDLFHPVTAIPSLIWGTLYGSRVAVTLTLVLGGIACWSLAQALGAGTLGRLTAGFLGVAGGHLTGRLQHGLVVLMLSVVTASFLLPAALWFFEQPDRRRTALFGLVGGLTVISGQAYIQIGIVALAPVFALLVFSNRQAFRITAWRLVQAGVIALTVASIQLLPILRFWGRLGKDTDFNFPRAQQFRFVATNLVINDPDFYNAGILDREPGFPGLYSNYIGWLAIILAVIGLVYLARRSMSRACFMFAFILGSLWISSGMPFEVLSRWQSHPAIQDFAAGVRTPSNIANLAVPAIIGLTALGLQYLLDAARSWYRITIRTSIAGFPLRLTLSLAILVPVLALAMVRNVAGEGKRWMWLENWDNNAESRLAANLQSDELRWITDLSNNPRLLILAPNYQLKIGNANRPWWIDGKLTPLPWAYLGVLDSVPQYRPEPLGDAEVWVSDSGNPYAQLTTASGAKINCSAVGRAGHIAVDCPAGVPGTLVVQERAFPGWQASSDGASVSVETTQTWLTVNLPSGASTIVLDFRPHSFWIGVVLSSAGFAWVVWWIVIPELLSSNSPERAWSAWRSRPRQPSL